MGSVADLINLAQFDISNRYGPSPGASEGLQKISKVLEEMNNRRRKQENQRKLSDMITKNIGSLEPEYSIDPAGGISVKYKSKKAQTTKFADAVKEAGERIGAGDDFTEVSGELNSQFPKLYNDRIDTYLANFIPDEEEDDGKAGRKRKKIKQVGKFDPRRLFPAFEFTGDEEQKDNFGFVIGETKKKGANTYKYIGNDQWQKL